MFDKGTMAIQWKKDSVSTNVAGTTRCTRTYKKGSRTALTPLEKLTQNGIINLNVKYKTTKSQS